MRSFNKALQNNWLWLRCLGAVSVDGISISPEKTCEKQSIEGSDDLTNRPRDPIRTPSSWFWHKMLCMSMGYFAIIHLLSYYIGIVAGLGFERAIIRPQVDGVGNRCNSTLVDLYPSVRRIAICLWTDHLCRLCSGD